MGSPIASYDAIDTHELVEFARRMAFAAEPNLDRKFGAALKGAAAPAVIKARANASWSSRIPQTIKVTGGRTRIVIRAGGVDAPHAKPFEHGGRSGSFRHPVFGNRENWVAQKARPFLMPALRSEHAAIEARSAAAVWTVLHEAGY